MALLVKDIKLPLNEKESLLSKVTAKTLGIPENAVKGLAIKRISLDARKKNDICFIYTVEISLEPSDERRILKRGLPTVCEAEAREIREVATGSIPLDKPIIVVGMGPGGLFAAYMSMYSGTAGGSGRTATSCTEKEGQERFRTASLLRA